MTFRRGGAGKRRDAVEVEIMYALRAMGATVIQLSGRAPVPDLLVGHRGRWYALEVKSGTKAGFTAAQREAMVNGTLAPTVIRSVAEAVAVIRT